MIRPSKILDGIANEIGRQAKESAIVWLAIAGLALVARRIEDRYEARVEVRAEASDEVEKPEECPWAEEGETRCAYKGCAICDRQTVAVDEEQPGGPTAFVAIDDPYSDEARCPDCGRVKCECP